MSSRRRFIKNTALVSGGSAFLPIVSSAGFTYFKNRILPNDQLNIGAIGINGMGWSNLMSAIKVPGVNVVALCDVDKNVLDKRMAELSKMNIDTSKVKTYGDYRKLLDQNSRRMGG